MKVYFSDLARYDYLSNYFIISGAMLLPGDVVEIGVFTGEGTKSLSDVTGKFAPNKKIYAIDNFDYKCDNSKNTNNITSAEILDKQIHDKYGNRNQEEIFYDNIKDCSNIIVIKGDSKKIELPTSCICFAFIDGNHNPDYVENDFLMIWHRLHSKGIIAMHDYGSDLPQVTSKIDELIDRHETEIHRICIYKDKSIIFITKK